MVDLGGVGGGGGGNVMCLHFIWQFVLCEALYRTLLKVRIEGNEIVQLNLKSQFQIPGNPISSS